MDDDDQDMEDINFDPESERQTLEMLERQLERQSGDRNSTNSDRTDRRSRRNIGRRTRRRQHGSSNAVREAAALGAALGRSANTRLRQSGSRLQARRRGRQLQENPENHASPAEDAGDTNNDDQTVSTTESIQPSSSSTALPSEDRANEEQGNKTNEQSNSSWEDVSEEEVVGSTENGDSNDDNRIGEANEVRDVDIEERYDLANYDET